MDIQIARFREMLELLKPAVARKPKLKSLEYVLIKEGKVVATDLETMVIIDVPEADLTSLVPFKDVVNMLQYTNGGELLHITSKKGKLSLSCTDASATFPVEDSGTFPEIPEFVPECEGTIDTDILVPALVSVLPYTTKEDQRPVLKGVTLILGEPIEVAAGDGFRMADKALPLSFPKNYVTILPRSSVSVLKHLWDKSPRTSPLTEDLLPAIMAKKYATVAHDGKQGLRFQFDNNITAIVKLVSGKPPEWLKLIPKEAPILKVKILAPDFERAVKRVGDVARGNNILRLQFAKGSMTVSAKDDDNEAKTTVSLIDLEGEPNKIGVNIDYLLDYLNGKQSIVTLSITAPTAPIAFQHPASPRVIIMPMNIK